MLEAVRNLRYKGGNTFTGNSPCRALSIHRGKLFPWMMCSLGTGATGEQRKQKKAWGFFGRLWHKLHLCPSPGLALTHVLEQNLKPDAGARLEAEKLVILLTDGKSQDDANLAAQTLKNLGIEIFAIGKIPAIDKLQDKANLLLVIFKLKVMFPQL